MSAPIQPCLIMKPFIISAFTSLVISSAVMASEGWITMFNGKDLSGWKSNAATEDQPAEKERSSPRKRAN